MEKNIALKGSVKNMSNLIKKSNGLFFKAVLLILLPVLIINCYTFYVNYNSIETDFSKADTFDFDNITDSNYVTDMAEAILSVQTVKSADDNFTDIAFYILNVALSVFIDGFIITLAVHLYFNKKYKTGDLVKLSLKRCFAVLFFGIISSWLLSYTASALNSSIISIAVLARAASRGSTLASASLTMYIGSAALQLLLTVLFVSWLMMIIIYSTVASVSGRCRWFIAVQYVFEILRKKKFKQTLHYMLPVTLAYIIPVLMQVISVYTGLYVGLIITALSVIIQTILNAAIWNYAVPDYFVLEKESGIEDKIRDFIKKSSSGRNNINNINNGNFSENNSDNTAENGKNTTKGDNGDNEPVDKENGK